VNVLITPSIGRVRTALGRPPETTIPVVCMPEAHVALDERWPAVDRTRILQEALTRWSRWLEVGGGILMVTSVGVWPLRDPAPSARPPADA
jgi:hypothetical protein